MIFNELVNRIMFVNEGLVEDMRDKSELLWQRIFENGLNYEEFL